LIRISNQEKTTIKGEINNYGAKADTGKKQQNIAGTNPFLARRQFHIHTNNTTTSKREINKKVQKSFAKLKNQ